MVLVGREGRRGRGREVTFRPIMPRQAIEGIAIAINGDVAVVMVWLRR